MERRRRGWRNTGDMEMTVMKYWHAATPHLWRCTVSEWQRREIRNTDEKCSYKNRKTHFYHISIKNVCSNKFKCGSFPSFCFSHPLRPGCSLQAALRLEGSLRVAGYQIELRHTQLWPRGFCSSQTMTLELPRGTFRCNNKWLCVYINCVFCQSCISDF